MKKSLAVEKMEIVLKYERGVHLTDLANMSYIMLKSTISTILQRKDFYKKLLLLKVLLKLVSYDRQF